MSWLLPLYEPPGYRRVLRVSECLDLKLVLIYTPGVTRGTIRVNAQENNTVAQTLRTLTVQVEFNSLVAAFPT